MNIKLNGLCLLGLLGAPFLLGGCQGDERISEVSAVQTYAQLQAENANLFKKSKAMESDLERRHRFYQAVKGRYEGSFQSEIGEINFRITFSPSLPPYITDRVRQLDEISSDLNNLYFNVQIIQWNPLTPMSAVGCRVSQVRPDITNGEITIASESCSNFYRLNVAGPESNQEDLNGSARLISERISDGNLDLVDSIIGEIQPTTNASIYTIKANRRD